jgi:hypothetical protein
MLKQGGQDKWWHGSSGLAGQPYKHDMHLLADIRDQPAEGNFCDGSGNALTSADVKNYK